MELVKPSFKILSQDYTLKGIFRAIEEAGRTCYKSVGTRYFRLKKEGLNAQIEGFVNRVKQNKNVVVKEGPSIDRAYYISIKNKDIELYPELESYQEETFDDCALYENLTAESFVDNLCKNGHTAMLEHGTVYLEFETPWSTRDNSDVQKYINNPYSEVSNDVYLRDGYKNGERQYAKAYVTTNFRVLYENNWLDDVKHICEPNKYHAKRISVKFICSRQTSHEFVRHRRFSFGQESTRFCNYSLNKFGSNLTFIEPCWFEDINSLDAKENITKLKAQQEWKNHMQLVEDSYFRLLDYNWTPQLAANILPNALKTELVMTGFVNDWKHFFDLRSDIAKTGKPHPQAEELATPLREEFKRRHLI